MNKVKNFIKNLFIDKEYEKEKESTTQIFYSTNKIGKSILPIFIISSITLGLACLGVYNYIKKKKEERLKEEHEKFLNSDYDNDGLTNKFEIENGLDINKPNPNVAYLYNKTNDINFAKKYGLPLDNDGIMDLNEKSFNDKLIENKPFIDNGVKNLENYFLRFSQDGKIENEELRKLDHISNLTKDLYKVVLNENLSKEKFKDTDYSLDLAIRLGFEDKYPKNETIFAIGNYAIAVRNFNVPEEFENLKLLVKATESENGKILMDFEPIIVKDNLNRNIEILVYHDIPGVVWVMAKHLGFTPYVLEHPEIWPSFGAKIKQNYIDIYVRLANVNGNDYGIPIPTFPEKHSLDSKEAWDVIIQQWNYYWYSTPQAGNVTQRITVFPWYDSKIQEEWIPNEIDRKIANHVFWQLPLYYYKRDGKLITGVKAMKQFLNDMEKLYPKIIDDYLKKGWDLQDPYGMSVKAMYGGWLTDRGYHGLRYTVSEWIGVNDIYEWEVPGAKSWEESVWIASTDPTRNGADNIIQGWKYGDQIKWLYAYTHFRECGWKSVGEFENISHQGNTIFRAFGIPFIAESHFFSHYAGSGNNLQTAHGYEPAIFGLPQSLIEKLKGKAIIFPGNGYAFLSSPNGLGEDIKVGMQDKREPNLRSDDVVFILNPPHWNRFYFYTYSTLAAAHPTFKSLKDKIVWVGISLRADSYYDSPTPGKN
ncbi:MAG: hypothetical protein QXI09_02270 [Candidatus Aenigmatarchaeota archaeon]